MNQSCPYCEGTRGYSRNQQVKRLKQTGWDGTDLEDSYAEILYEGKTLRCIDCGEKVTSFVTGLRRES